MDSFVDACRHSMLRYILKLWTFIAFLLWKFIIVKGVQSLREVLEKGRRSHEKALVVSACTIT